MAVRTGAWRRRIDRRVYILAAGVALLLVFTGFARTFFLKLAFGTPELPLLLHVHGWVMTSWFTLFLVQVSLVESGCIKLHRRLGVFGACLAVAVVVMGTTVAIHAARIGHGPPGIPSPVFLLIPLSDMLVFTLLVGSGLLLRRRRSDCHKRLMLLATLGILTAAIGRIPLPGLFHRPMSAALVMMSLVLACVAVDSWRHRRLHPAFAAGAALIIASWPLRLALSHTSAWLRIADWLMR